MIEMDSERENHIRLIEAQHLINGRFTDVRRIDPRAGDGNFSLVFKALDNSTNRKVALKFFNPLCMNDEYRARCFDRESEILLILQGQRDILQLVEPRTELRLRLTENVSGIPVQISYLFLTTELADSNILHYIYADEVTSTRSLQFFRAMCRAVQRIHTRSICHRDIKPENFFRIGRHEVHLGDFGTARILDDSIPPLSVDYFSFRGDKRYTAPEQCVFVDDTTSLFKNGDMYSLGAVLFEMFTKQPLYQLIFSDRFHFDLSQHFEFISPENREIVYNSIMPDIVRSRSLPNIDDFDSPIPACIKVRLDRLYKQLACLDYKYRTSDFSTVFHQINMCTGILEKETAYMRMVEFRRKRQKERKERKQTVWQIQ